jgi:prepilin-type processing-associated H-X9-DG protein
MTTTIDGTNITFVDGSVWNGTQGALTPDGNSSNTATSFNIGHIILANTIFTANYGGFTSGGYGSWPLNANFTYFYYSNSGVANPPYANLNYGANDARLGSQSYYIYNSPYSIGSSTSAGLAGTWRGRGQATAAGVYQYYGYFTLLERVA